MLKFLRKHTKTIMWVVTVGVVATFVLWGTSVRYGGRGLNYAGTLFGKQVPIEEYSRSFEECRMMGLLRYGEMFYRIIRILNLNNQAWDRLTLLKEAKRSGLKVSDKEVISAIADMAIFRQNGKFDQKTYERLLEGLLRASPADFEEMIRNTLLIAKLQERIMFEAIPTQEQVKEEYKKAHEKADASYILVDPEGFESQVEITDDLLKSYYSSHTEEFRKPEQADIEFLGVDFSKFSDTVTVSDEEIKKYYESHKEEFKITPQNEEPAPSEVEGSTYRSLEEVGDELQIRLRNEKMRRAARETMEDVAVELVENPDFESLAKKYDVAHGKSGFFAREDSIPEIGPSAEIAAVAFGLKKNEASDPIGTEKGYYIIKLLAKKPSFIPPFEEIKEAVTQSYIKQRCDELAKAKAAEVLSAIKEKVSAGADFWSAAEELGFEVRETNLFSRGEYIEGLGESNDFAEAAFSIKLKEIAGPVKTEKGYAILSLNEYVPMDEEAFQKDRDIFEKQLKERKELEHYRQWFSDLKRSANLISNVK